MTLCDTDHDEVCYEGKKCPACELVREIESLTERLIQLQNEI